MLFRQEHSKPASKNRVRGPQNHRFGTVLKPEARFCAAWQARFQQNTHHNKRWQENTTFRCCWGPNSHRERNQAPNCTCHGAKTLRYSRSEVLTSIFVDKTSRIWLFWSRIEFQRVPVSVKGALPKLCSRENGLEGFIPPYRIECARLRCRWACTCHQKTPFFVDSGGFDHSGLWIFERAPMLSFCKI